MEFIILNCMISLSNNIGFIAINLFLIEPWRSPKSATNIAKSYSPPQELEKAPLYWGKTYH